MASVTSGFAAGSAGATVADSVFFCPQAAKKSTEQIAIPEDVIDGVEFLKEGQDVEVVVHAETETPLSCELPPFIEATVTYTEPGLKGDTTTNALKPATIDTGAQVMVPLFIEIGEKIKVDTRTKEYAERAK